MLHKTQTRLVLILLVAIGSLAGGLVLYQQAERARIHQFFLQLKQEENATLDKLLELKGASLQMFAVDYTYWDEMVRCIELADRQWADEQIAEALGTYKAQVAWVYRPDRSLVYSTHDEEEESLAGFTLPDDALAQFVPDGRFWHFFIESPAGPVEIRAATVHPSSDAERKTRPRGYFVVGRLWNEAYVAELARLTGTTMQLGPRVASSAPQATAERNGIIAMERPLPNQDRAPLAMLSAQVVSDAVREYNRSSAQQFGMLILFAVMTIGLISVALVHFVTRPLNLLSSSLQTGSTEALKPLVRNRTEFGQLAKLVGQFFGQNATLVKEVTERKQAEVELAAEAERARILFEDAPDASVLTDLQGTILDGNRAAEKLFGYRREELIGKNLLKLDLLPMSEVTKVAELLVRNALGQATGPDELAMGRRDGTLIAAELCTHVVTIHGRKVVLSSLRDVTERKRIETALRERVKELNCLYGVARLVEKPGISPDELMQGVVSLLANAMQRAEVAGARARFGGKEYRTPDWEDTRLRIQEPLRVDGVETGAVELGYLPDPGESGLSFLPEEHNLLFAVSTHLGRILERQRAAAALRESEGRFRRAFENSGVGKLLTGLDGRLLRVNHAFAAMLGYSVDELQSRDFQAVTHPDDVAANRETMVRLQSGTEGYARFEKRYLHRDGDVVWVDLSTVLLRDADGKPHHFVADVVNITARKQAERETERHAELQAAINEMLRVSLEDLPLASILEKSLGIITAISWLVLESRGSIHLVEDDPEVLVMKAQRGLGNSLLAMCDRVRFGRCLCGRAASTRQLVFADHVDDSHENTYEGIHDHGHYCVPMLSADQRVLGVLNLYFTAGGKRNKETEELLGVVANVLAGVVQRKLAEETLRTSEAQLSNAMEIARLGHWEYNVADDLFTFNDHFYDIFRTTAEKVGGYKMSSAEYARRFVHPDDMALVGIETRKAIETTDPHFSRQLEHRVIHADGSVGYISVRFFVVKDAQGRTVKTFGANQDITERKLAEAEIAQKNAELVELNDVKNQLLGMAAHDLRNPLSVVSTASAYLLDDASLRLPKAKRADFLRRINSGSRFMLKLIDDLLDVAKIEAGRLDLELREEDLCGLIDDTLALNRMLADKKNIRLDFTPECGLSPLRFDRGKVEQVLNNLVSNALKFSAPGTAVMVKASRVNGSVVVSVRDQGQGIAAKELDRLFKPFGRTSARVTAGESSTGLGLAICRKIVEGHGGRIWAESELGHGSTFSFSLPVANDESQASDLKSQTGKEGSTAS